MNIIKGLSFQDKIKDLCTQINFHKPSIIITEHVEYIEDILLETQPVLLDIEVKTLKQFQKDLLIQKGIFNRQLFPEPLLYLYIRRLLHTHTFHYFHSSNNPYPLIKEIIKSMRCIHENHIILKPDTDDILTINKCEDLKYIDEYLSQYPYYWNMEDMCIDCLDTLPDIYIIGDDYLEKRYLYFFEELAKNTSVINYITYDDHYPIVEGDVLHTYDNDLYHLFDFEDVSSTKTGYEIIGATQLQEVMKVLSDIKDKVMKGARYQDFMIVTNQDIYKDLIRECSNQLNMPYDIPDEVKRYYDQDFIKILKTLPTIHKHTFKGIIYDLLPLELSSQYQDYLQLIICDDEIDKEEFRFFLEATVPNKKEIVKTKDSLHIEDMNACTSYPRHLYILGCNEGLLPKDILDEGLLLKSDYDSLNNQPFDTIERMSIQELSLIRLLSQDWLSMTLSYAKNDIEGNELMPSIFMNRVKEYYHLKTISPTLMIYKSEFYLRSGFIPDDLTYELIYDYHKNHNQSENIKEEYRDMLGKGMSISRLETYNKCPYQYYIKYGLRIEKYRDKSLQVTDLGTLCHYILETSLEDFDVEKHAYNFIEDHLKEEYTLPINKYFLDQLIKDMKVTVNVVNKQLDSGDFDIFDKERKIVSEIHDIPMLGIIDRVDSYDDYVRIIDYKSSSKDIDLDLARLGFNVQMLLYMKILRDSINKNPAGVFYFNMKKRIFDIKDNTIDKIMNSYKLKGYVIDDENYTVIHHSGDSIPAKLKKDGTPAAHSHIISVEEYDDMISDIIDHIYELYISIRDGLIPIYPAKGKDSQIDHVVYPCTYCDYHSVCLFDVFLNENHMIIPGGDDDATV